ncbi:MAG: hypothetical protein K2X27_18740 [Candidatus Obscuribacterales bacterium]|nr:hypothetical protein [Candidatus Obscuribacterales bacterium]
MESDNSQPDHDLRKRLSEKLRTVLGFYFPESRLDEMQKRLSPYLQSLKSNSQSNAFASLLMSDWNQDVIDALVPHLSIGETYFFRDPAIWSNLENSILPEFQRLLNSGARKEINIWSAACCTGEEPYTLAMLLSRMPSINKAAFRIYASDINKGFLEHARNGVYAPWAMRATSAAMKTTHFEDADKGRFQISDSIRNSVRFFYHNLVEGKHPLEDKNAKFDLIFCRNVLMYFNAEQSMAVIRRMSSLLHDNGCLLLSPHDMWHSNITDGFEVCTLPDLILLRKKSVESQAKESRVAQIVKPLQESQSNFHSQHNHHIQISHHPHHHISLPQDAHLHHQSGSRTVAEQTKQKAVHPSQLLAKLGQYAEAANQLEDELRSRAPSVEDLKLLIQCLSNSGKDREALNWVEEALKTFPLEATFYYLKANLLEESADLKAAIRSLQQAIFLEPDFIIAHFALYNLLNKANKPAQAELSYANLIRLLEKQAAAELLPESDGLTAGQLMSLLKSGRASSLFG